MNITGNDFLDEASILYNNIIAEVEDYAIILLDTEGNITNWNKGAENIKGYKAKEVIGKNFRMFYTAEDKQKKLPDRLLEEARLAGRVQHEGWRLAEGDDLFWANVVITALYDKERNHIGYIKITRDLSERIAAEKVINEYERSLTHQAKQSELMKELYITFITEVEDHAIIMLDKDGIIMDWNKGAENIKGYTPNEIIGKHFSVLYTEDDIKAMLPSKLLYKANTEGVAQNEGWRLKKDRTKFWANVTIKALYDEVGHIKGYVKITKNLTKKMLADKAIAEHATQLEEEIQKVKEIGQELTKSGRKLEKSTQVRVRFEYAANNTMQKPLLNTINRVQHLKNLLEQTDNPTAEEALQDILTSAYESNKHVQDLSLLSVVLEDRIDVTPSKFDLEILTGGLINKQTIEQNTNHNIDFQTQGEMVVNLPLPIVSYTIENLISNAIKFSPQNSTINITCRNDGSNLTIKVEDNGAGIPKTEQSELFDIFFRGSNISDTLGSGLSLYLVKNYINSMNGKIICQSTPGKRTVFTVVLPLVSVTN